MLEGLQHSVHFFIWGFVCSIVGGLSWYLREPRGAKNREYVTIQAANAPWVTGLGVVLIVLGIVNALFRFI
jgi:hypothetical protein